MRNRFWYAISYEDGDCEDMNQNELDKAFKLYHKTLQLPEDSDDREECEDIVETDSFEEGSEYSYEESDDDESE